jgi:hypothetical protein
MSKRRPTLKLGYKPLPAPSSPDDDALAKLLDDPKPGQGPAPDPRKRPARMMPYSIKAHPEHEGAVSLARAAPLATRTDFERLCRENPGKVLNALAETLPDGKDLVRNLLECARANGANVSVGDSQGDFRLMARIKP